MRRADIEVPNHPVDMDSWGRSACYPRGTFYPLSDTASTCRTEYHYQAVVKVPGPFRPVARNEHLYPYWNFAGPVVEAEGKSLRHSCRSDLTRHAISLP